MHFAISVFELHIPAARNLKDKRRVVKALVDRLHRHFKISIAETGFHDLHQRSEISIAVVQNGRGELERLMNEIHDLIIASQPEAVLLGWEPQFLEEAP